VVEGKVQELGLLGCSRVICQEGQMKGDVV